MQAKLLILKRLDRHNKVILFIVTNCCIMRNWGCKAKNWGAIALSALMSNRQWSFYSWIPK